MEIERVGLLFEDLSGRLAQISRAAQRAQFDPAVHGGGEILELLASLSRALEQLRTRVQAHEQEREELRALQEIGAVINSSLELSDVLQQVMDAIIELTGAERGFLMLIGEDTDEMQVQVGRNLDRETIGRSSFEISRSIAQRVAETGEAVVTLNAQTDPRFAAQESIISYALRSILCVPLKIRERITGVVYVDNRIAAGIFDDADRDLLSAFANQAAVAIANARLFQRIREQLANITEMKSLMDDVFASIASGVITVDDDDSVALFNRAAEQILGVPADQVLSRAYHSAFAHLDGFVPLVDRVKEEGGQHRLEVEAETKPRAGRASLSLVFSPLRDIEERVKGVAVVVDDLSEKKRLESVRRYLPPALVEQVRNLDAAQRPQRRQITILFADVRNFSGISEKLPPEELIEILNGYFAVAAAAINRYEGVIDKYMGDAIMAEFNTPLNPQEDHVTRAVRTALAMRQEVATYHEELPDDRRLRFGVGIHSGEAVVGNVGTHFRKDYSAIGDAVNLARRLQEMAGPNQILISTAVCEKVREWAPVGEVGMRQVKGRQSQECLFELL